MAFRISSRIRSGCYPTVTKFTERSEYIGKFGVRVPLPFRPSCIIRHPSSNPCHKPDIISLIFIAASFAPDEQNNDAINQLGRKLERLTEAVVSSTSSAAAPMKDSRPSNTKGHPPSASRDSDHDLRCWEPCCDGRKFSNKSNIIRHQRERSGELGKFRCSFCNACFSRSSSRNAHEARRCCGT